MVKKCTTCGRQIKEPNYELKSCKNCLTKSKAKGLIAKEIRHLNKDAKQQLKELKLNPNKLSPIFKDYSTYEDNYYQLFKKKVSFDDYCDALRAEKLRLAHNEADRIRKTKRVKPADNMPDEFIGQDVDVDFDDLRNNDGINQFMKQGKIDQLKPQYESQTDNDFIGANAFHDNSINENPIKKISIQNRMKAEFFDKCE